MPKMYTHKDVQDLIHNWISELVVLKNLSDPIYFRGFAWEAYKNHNYLKLKIMYSFGGAGNFGKLVNILIPNKIFSDAPFTKFDDTIKISDKQLDSETIIKLRFLFLIYHGYLWVHSNPYFNASKSAQYVGNQFLLIVEDSGDITKLIV